MANYGKYYIAVRLLLLKQYLEANAGRNRIVKRRELEDLLREHDMPVEKKTLYADFAALGDICGLQLEYDVHKKGYHCFDVPFGHFIKGLLSIEIVAHVLYVVSVIANCNVRYSLCCLRYYEHLKYF